MRNLNVKDVYKRQIISSLVIFIFATYFIYHADSLIVYGIAMTLGCMAVVGFSMVGTGLLGANWFPTKKGLYMGWATSVSYTHLDVYKRQAHDRTKHEAHDAYAKIKHEGRIWTGKIQQDKT